MVAAPIDRPASTPGWCLNSGSTHHASRRSRRDRDATVPMIVASAISFVRCSVADQIAAGARREA